MPASQIDILDNVHRLLFERIYILRHHINVWYTGTAMQQQLSEDFEQQLTRGLIVN